MNEKQWSLLNPVGDCQETTARAPGRVPDLNGKTIGLFWNGKPNGDVFLNEVARQLETRFAGLNIVRMWEVRPATRTFYGNSPDHLGFMAQNADLVIGAIAD